MKDAEILIAEMYEGKSQYRNSYFYGHAESGGKFLLKKVHGKKSEKGEQVWKLLLVKR